MGCCNLKCDSLDCCYGAGPSNPRPRPQTPPPPPSPPPPPPRSPPSPPPPPPKYPPGSAPTHIPLPSDPQNGPIDFLLSFAMSVADVVAALQNFLTQLEVDAGAQLMSVSKMDDLYVQLKTLEHFEVARFAHSLIRIYMEMEVLGVKGKCPGQRMWDILCFADKLKQDLGDLNRGIWLLKRKIVDMLVFNRNFSRLDVGQILSQFNDQIPPFSLDGFEEPRCERGYYSFKNGDGMTHVAQMEIDDVDIAEGEEEGDYGTEPDDEMEGVDEMVGDDEMVGYDEMGGVGGSSVEDDESRYREREARELAEASDLAEARDLAEAIRLSLL